MQITHPAYSVVLTYEEHRDRLTVHAIPSADLTALKSSRLEMPILLDEFNFTLDDEFARRLGVAMLNLIALGQPDIRRYMSVTPGPKRAEGS
jgi:hypothetical protein